MNELTVKKDEPLSKGLVEFFANHGMSVSRSNEALILKGSKDPTVITADEIATFVNKRKLNPENAADKATVAIRASL